MSTDKHSKIFAAPEVSATGKVSLLGLTLSEIEEKTNELGLPKFRAKQLYSWIYQKGAISFEEMTNLSKDLRETLEASFVIERPQVISHQVSTDGTQKWLLKMVDGQEIETVFIPEKERGTLCVSSQVGCTLTCKFCHTGTQPLVRNLGAKEIVMQVMHARDALKDWTLGPTEGRTLTNIVFMGMGEPFYNYENVSKAVQLMIAEDGMNFSRRKITLSTSGVVPLFERCSQELNVGLAISLHATNDELRNQLVPLNNKYPIHELLNACRAYSDETGGKIITFEYVMLKDVNDSLEDANALVSLLKSLPSKVNLIPFNPWPGSDFECSDTKTIYKFAKVLEDAGFQSPIRRARGQDILAACGQLRSESQRQKLTKTQTTNQEGDAI